MTATKNVAPLVVTAVLFIVVTFFVFLEHDSPRYDAKHVVAAACGECHTQIYPEWWRSPHANMVREPDATMVRAEAGVFPVLERAGRKHAIAGWLNRKLRGQPVACIANATKLDKGSAMSVCGRCHGASAPALNQGNLNQSGFDRITAPDEQSVHRSQFAQIGLLASRRFIIAAE